ncbi:plasmid segregation protein ParM, partial [Salmonella enterica subsp. enterica serovar Lubbock]|nr:plasmid segregation protein ParM [Salmonella enterica subsp. enterica serovar Lubbock]
NIQRKIENLMRPIRLNKGDVFTIEHVDVMPESLPAVFSRLVMGEDVVTYDDGAIDVYTAWEEMGKVRDALEAAGLKADSAEVSMI